MTHPYEVRLHVGDARRQGKRRRTRGLLMIAIRDDGRVEAVSWGRDRADCRVMGGALDAIMDRLESGEIPVEDR